MAVNPMQRKARNSFLLGIIITLLITGVIITLLFLQLKQVKEEQAAELAKKVNVYTLKQDVKSGQILTEDMFSIQSVSKDTIPVNATSMGDVVSSWYLQTEDGKTLGRDADGLYINEADNIIELTLKDGQYSYEGESVTLRNDPYIYEIEENVKVYLVGSNSVENDITRVYEDLNTGNCYVLKIINGAVQKEYIKLNSVPLLSKINMKANTIITPDYVVQSDAVVTNDARKEEYNMISLPIDLMTDDYIDIRLMLPSGQNFIVISKTQVEIPTNSDKSYVADTIRIQLNEGEILSLSSAMVEAYGIQGAYLYANKYVEPGIQDPATPTYYPNDEVINQINANPNIVGLAREELNKRLTEASRNIRGQNLQPLINDNPSYDANVQTGMDTGTTNSDTARRKYLESLGY